MANLGEGASQVPSRTRHQVLHEGIRIVADNSAQYDPVEVDVDEVDVQSPFESFNRSFLSAEFHRHTFDNMSREFTRIKREIAVANEMHQRLFGDIFGFDRVESEPGAGKPQDRKPKGSVDHEPAYIRLTRPKRR